MKIQDPRFSAPRALEKTVVDALVIGGGPAGLAAGIALRQQGLDVIVADALVPPIDKACGEGLLPDARAGLAQLGVDLRADLSLRSAGYEFLGIRFLSGIGEGIDVATADFLSGKGIGVRRVDLHARLAERAAEIGVRLLWGTRADFQAGAGATIEGRRVRYRYLIGADGQSSQVRRRADLGKQMLTSTRFGFRRHYRTAPWSNYVEIHWGKLGQIYVTPIGADEICVAALTSHRGLSLDRILESIPDLQGRLSNAEALGRDRGAPTTTRKLRRVTRGNVALLGDASGSADAITGGGLGASFRQAILLADALARNEVREYEAAHAELSRLPQSMAAALLAMDRWQGLRRRVIRTLARRPAYFERLLRVHTGDESLGHFLLTQAAPLSWQVLMSRPRAIRAGEPVCQSGSPGRSEIAPSEAASF